jgi:hypothetical protein
VYDPVPGLFQDKLVVCGGTSLDFVTLKESINKQVTIFVSGVLVVKHGL